MLNRRRRREGRRIRCCAFTPFLQLLVLAALRGYTSSKGILHPFDVVAPFHNFKPTRALRSIIHQRYAGPVRIWLIDDGSDIALEELSQFCPSWIWIDDDFLLSGEQSNLSHAPKHINCLRCTHGGPAKARWVAFTQMRGRVNPAGVLLFIDGDDELLGRDAISRINQYYASHDILASYGSYRGAFSSSTVPLPNIESADYQPRLEESWIYGHPRSMRALVLDELSSVDFRSNGRWLQRATDRAYFYRALEIAGLERVHFGEKILYKYNTHKASSRKKISLKARQDDLRYVQSLPASKRINRRLLIGVYVETITDDTCGFEIDAYEIDAYEIDIDFIFYTDTEEDRAIFMASCSLARDTNTIVASDAFASICSDVTEYYDLFTITRLPIHFQRLHSSLKRRFSKGTRKSSWALPTVESLHDMHLFDYKVCFAA